MNHFNCGHLDQNGAKVTWLLTGRCSKVVFRVRGSVFCEWKSVNFTFFQIKFFLVNFRYPKVRTTFLFRGVPYVDRPEISVTFLFFFN